jgi:hypothetical protein
MAGQACACLGINSSRHHGVADDLPHRVPLKPPRRCRPTRDEAQAVLLRAAF